MTMNTDLNQLLIFAKVAENQSFTKSALELGIEKSTVSSKISQLEKRLGVRLLNRTTRLVTLTEAGAGYYQYCRQIVESAEEADHYAETLTLEPQGILRVSVPLDFGQLLVQQFIKSFMQAHPNLKIDWVVTDREVDLIGERYDLALRIGPGALKDSSLIGKKLFDIKMGLFASAAFVKEQGEPTSVTELSDYPFIFFSTEQGSAFKFTPDFNAWLPEHISGNLKINDILTCREAAVAGLGISILPVDIIQKELKSHRLKQILPNYKLPSMALFAVYPSRQWTPSKVKVFLQCIEAWKH